MRKACLIILILSIMSACTNTNDLTATHIPPSITSTETLPDYLPNTPKKHSLLEEGMTGTRLILVGYVLDQNCVPQSNAWLDFWQADASGEYDNAGYRLRGHQFTDAQGRYYLETILPGLYSSRPIEHIHVKVKPEGGAEVTSQLYFPQRPIEGLTVTIEERGDYLIGYFNFVVQK
jgi:protocatechuate 3,4-dioxygenase beta subunit